MSIAHDEYDTDDLRSLEDLYKKLERHDFDGTATFGELLALEYLQLLFSAMETRKLLHEVNEKMSAQRGQDQ